MEEPQSKKFKSFSCVVCGEDADDDTDKNEIFSILLKTHLVPCRKKSILGSENFDFCGLCTKILEELIQLQNKLENILNDIEQKKTEIRTKIYKVDSICLDRNVSAFRKAATTEFRSRKRVKITDLQRTLNKEGNNIDNPISLPELNDAEYINNNSLNSTSTNTSYEQSDSNENYRAVMELLKSNDSDDHENGQEGMSSQEKELIDFYKSDSNVYQPSFVDDLNFNNYYEWFEEEVQIPQAVVICPEKEILIITPEPSISEEESDKILEKPPLSYSQLAVLAITNSEKMQLKLEQIYDFISENFHYYHHRREMNHWKQGLRTATGTCDFLTVFRKFIKVNGESKRSITYGIKPCDEFIRSRNLMYGKLIENFCKYLIYPERISSFQLLLMREVPEIKKLLPISRIAESKRSEVFHTTTGKGHLVTTESSPLIVKSPSPVIKEENISYLENNNIPEIQSSDKIKSADSKPPVEPLVIDITEESPTTVHIEKRPPPVLTYEQLCVLAIMNTKNLIMKFDDVHSFIMDNFQFSEKMEPPLKNVLKVALTSHHFLNSMPKSNNNNGGDDESYLKCTYTVKDCQITNIRRHKLANILCSVENLASMLFPGRVQGFIKNVMTNKRTNILGCFK